MVGRFKVDLNNYDLMPVLKAGKHLRNKMRNNLDNYKHNSVIKQYKKRHL